MIRAKKIVAWVCATAMLAGTVTYMPVTGEAAKKKAKLNRTRASVMVGKTIKISLKNGNKKGKVTWKSSKSNIAKIVKKSKKGNKAYANVKGVKKGKSVITAVYKLGKSKKTLKCTVTVQPKKTTDTVIKTEPTAVVTAVVNTVPTAAATAVATNAVSNPTEVPTATPEPFNIIDNSKASAMMYIDAKDSEYDGISIIAEAFKADVARVAGIGTDDEGVANESPNGLQVVTDKASLKGRAIIAGSIGANGNDLIKQLASEGKIDVSAIEGKWESYKLQVVKNPVAGVDEALVIAGSDKRGTIYGIFRISELMGVSPWVWWGDATPAVRAKVDLDGAEINVTSKEPSVKYRGIFLNDESPSLTNWSNNKYGQRNYKFYAHVFELILRLKGDYLWPAMWGNAFSKDGVSSVKGGVDPEYEGDTLANAKLADKYGIVMGTSHHEPCYRAGNEWGSEYGKYKGSISENAGNAWNKYNLPGEAGYNEKINQAIEKFWDDGVKRNGQFDNICTVGMRGENDSSLPAADDPPKYAELLNHIINQQKNILKNNDDTNPTQLVVYKEVENAWNEGALYEQDCMKDTIAMLCDDNWAYVRTLPTYEQQQMVGGLGMYYHFDYVGAPKSYTWIQTTQISRIWDQMSVSYDYGIDDVWVVNVGDLKPMELDISYFLDLGYDYEKWGVDGNTKLAEYKDKWIREQFGKADGSGLKEEEVMEAMQLIVDYLDLETERKVEHVLYNTANNCSDMFSVDNYNEAQEILIKCNNIMDRAEALKEKVPADLQAAFYQLVYYPAMAVPNVLKIQIYAALNNKYAGMGLTAANLYKTLCEQAIDLDNELYDTMNNDMPGAPQNGKKWQGMQSADQKYHIGMTAWNTDSGKLPSLKTVSAGSDSGLNVLVEDITGSMTKAYTEGEASLPAFTNVNKEVYTIELANKGDGAYNFTAAASADWIVLSKTSGSVNDLDAIQVSIDWSKVTADSDGTVTVSDGTNTVTVKVSAEMIKTDGLADKTYVVANDYAVIDVANYTNAVAGTGVTNAGKQSDNKMIVVPDNGKYLTSLRTSSSTITYNDAKELAKAPYAEYTVYVPTAGTFTLDCQFNPTSNLEYANEQLRYGISIDGGDIKITNSIVDNYLAGTWQQGTWATDIEKNGRTSKVSGISLSAGVHTIRYYQCDPNMALIRMVLHDGDLSSVYSAPQESYYVGKNVDAAARLADKNSAYRR
jgi:hypothetical protein